MQRRATKQSRGANAAERRFIAAVKEMSCICCGRPGPSIVDHIWGSSKKLYNGLERVHVGHYGVLPLCTQCDSVKTRGSRKAFENKHGRQADLWVQMVERSGLEVPAGVMAAIYEESLPW